MDLLKVFESISAKLVADFERSKAIQHNGGMGNVREDAFKGFLQEYLPRKYGLGKGEAISSLNEASGEMDIIIYDADHCPRLIPDESHSVYPVESVFGAISMKSHLDSVELADAYSNIVSLKKIMPKTGFQHVISDGFTSGMNPVVPVTAIVAYSANRSLDAIANQLKKLDEEVEDVTLRPDFVVVLNKGMIASSRSYRGQFNKYSIPNDCCEARRTGRHTLFKFYLSFLNELNSVQLAPLDLNQYSKMPARIGQYLVTGKYNLIHHEKGNETVIQLTPKFLDKLVTNSEVISVSEALQLTMGFVPRNAESIYGDLSRGVNFYNPRSCTPEQAKAHIESVIETGQQPDQYNGFSSCQITINGVEYTFDLQALESEDVVVIDGITAEELWAI